MNYGAQYKINGLLHSPSKSLHRGSLFQALGSWGRANTSEHEREKKRGRPRPAKSLEQANIVETYEKKC